MASGLKSFLLAFCLAGNALALDSSVTQLVVSIAPDWDSTVGRLQLFERQGREWHAAAPPVRVLYGANGLAWGRGELGTDQPGLKKAERDKRAPAGVFKIGIIYTHDSSLPSGADYPFHTITASDAWVDDPTNPFYNRHIVIPPSKQPPWFEKQRMRLDDPPHRWLVEIRHNADPPVAGAGSAIFFHIQRGHDRKSAGCTVMPEPAVVSLVRWLRTKSDPHYVLLPRDEYLRLWKAWGLPSPQAASALLN